MYVRSRAASTLKLIFCDEDLHYKLLYRKKVKKKELHYQCSTKKCSVIQNYFLITLKK